MTLLDLLKLVRHYLKLVIALPIACAVVAALVCALMPATYEAKATLITNGDVALAGGYAQNNASTFSQNGIEVSAKTDTSSKSVTITAEGGDYGGCIAAVNATVLAAADDCRAASDKAAVNVSEATSAQSSSPSIPKMALVALLAGLFVAICIVVIIDMVKTPIKSKSDIEETSEFPVLGIIPSRDRGERLIANIRFLGDAKPSTIAVVPVGLTGATTTCAELASAFERAGYAVSRTKGSAHAQSLGVKVLPGVLSIIECPSLSEGMGAAYIAHEADLTILCAREWSDSRATLAQVVEELKFAKANVGGAVFLADLDSDEDSF